MKKGLKIAIIGSGSTYTPELIEGLINKRETLPLDELYFMDIDERKRTIVGGLCVRMIKAAGLTCKCVLTDNLDEALDGADFVLAQIRVGKLPARVKDEKIPLKYGLLGQETNGIGGMFKGLRTVPVIVDIAHRMEKLCPNAWLINFSNPAGMVAEAVLNNTKIKMFGLCNVPINMEGSVKSKLGLDDAEIEYIGLNHLSWITSIKANGHEYLADALNAGLNSDAMKNIPATGFPKDLIQAVGGIPNSYLEYFYFRSAKVEHCQHAEKCRGEECMEIEENLLKIYSDSELHVKPELLSKRGGSRYSEVAINLVNSIHNNINDIQVVNLKNNGAVPFMDDNDVIETRAYIGKDGGKTLKVEHYNDHIAAYMKMMKSYEKHAVKAALTGDVNEAFQALLINPLTGDYDKFAPCFWELLEAHKEFLPNFAKALEEHKKESAK